jgi:hypothetical protein
LAANHKPDLDTQLVKMQYRTIDKAAEDAHDFVRRDLRWNNIIKDGTYSNDCVRIIDFEHSGREGFVDFALSIWPTLDNGCYTKRVG